MEHLLLLLFSTSVLPKFKLVSSSLEGSPLVQQFVGEFNKLLRLFVNVVVSYRCILLQNNEDSAHFHSPFKKVDKVQHLLEVIIYNKKVGL